MQISQKPLIQKEEHAKKMKEFEEKFFQQNNVFRIVVCGKFKTGKTSLLNLLLGLELPVMAVTATGVITKIVYQTSMSAEFEDGSRKQISKNELNRYITVSGKDLDGVKYSEAVSVNVPCESPFMMEGQIEFWDTPGLEDDERLTDITMNAVKKCDLAILVMDAAKILSQKEKLFLYQLQETLGGNVLVVLNRWDMLRDDERTEVRKTADTFLKNIGNDICGYGQYLMTSANLDSIYVDSLRNKLYDICKDENLRKQYINNARSAGIKSFAEEWIDELEQDIGKLEFYLESCRNAAATEENRMIKELEKDYHEKKGQIKGSLSEIMCKVDERSYWTKALQTVKSTAEWEKKYVTLSADIMKKSLQDIYQEVREITGEYLTSCEYPECHPLPTMSDENVWNKMAWGQNYAANHSGGMFAGAVAGAAAGSAFLGIGAIPGGVLGFFAGVMRDAKKDEKDLEAFRSSCINRTLTAFYQEPAINAKREIQNYMDGVLGRLEDRFMLKCDKIRKEREVGDEYSESLLLLKELQQYKESIAKFCKKRL